MKQILTQREAMIPITTKIRVVTKNPILIDFHQRPRHKLYSNSGMKKNTTFTLDLTTSKKKNLQNVVVSKTVTSTSQALMFLNGNFKNVNLSN